MNTKKISVLLIALFSAISLCRPAFKKVLIGPGSRIQRTNRGIVSFDHKHIPIKRHRKKSVKKGKHHRVIHHRPRRRFKRRFSGGPVFISSGYHLHDDSYNGNILHDRSIKNNSEETIYVTNAQGETITITPDETKSLQFSVIFWIEDNSGRAKHRSTERNIIYEANGTIVAN